MSFSIADRFRAHMKTEPGITRIQLAEREGMDPRRVSWTLRKMREQGTARSEGEGANEARWYFCREPMSRRPILSPEEAHRRRIAQSKRWRDNQREAQGLQPRVRLDPEEAKARRRERKRLWEQAKRAKLSGLSTRRSLIDVQAKSRVESRPVAVIREAETVDQWMQRTGKVPQALPPFQYVPHVRIPVRVAQRATRAAG